MSRFTKANRLAWAGAFAAASICGAAMVPVLAADTPAKSDAIPNFSSANFGWLLAAGGTDYLTVPGQTPPVTNDPKYPHVGNNQGGQPTERVADVTNPLLKPWAAEQMKQRNDEIIKGKRGFVAQSRCWPGGVPGQLLFPAEPIYFIQTSKEVWMIWQRDHHVRRVYLNQAHSKNPTPTWFGESVGHYENGDTLVIDTIGFVEHPYSYVDNYRTPHTKDLHVVERWKTNPDGKSIDASFTAEDPGTFTKPWGGRMHWNRVDRGQMIESNCAENNANYFNLDEWPMPEAKTADF